MAPEDFRQQLAINGAEAGNRPGYRQGRGVVAKVMTTAPVGGR
jgi:hypothetical protein